MVLSPSKVLALAGVMNPGMNGMTASIPGKWQFWMLHSGQVSILDVTFWVMAIPDVTFWVMAIRDVTCGNS